MADKKDIGALWQKKTKTGATFLSGTINDVDVVIFKNDYKKEDRHPDWKVYPSQKQQRNDDDDMPFGN